MLARIVGDLEDVEGDPVDARLAQSVQAGDVRASARKGVDKKVLEEWLICR